MEIREAIISAADWINAHPDQYSFKSYEVPSCGSKGCLIGWVGYFLGIPEGSNSWTEGSERIMGIELSEFNNRCSVLCQENSEANLRILNYQINPAQAANLLRLYADKYHPAKPSKPLGSSIALEIMARPYQEREHA